MANKSIPRIEGILQYYTTAIGNDYNAYRNHVYRVYHLTLLLHQQDLSIEENEYLCIALAFHDMGVWTHHTMDYLPPSTDLALFYMNENEMKNTALVSQLIGEHHKISKHNNALVESVRKADLTDLSFGIIGSNLPKSFYQNLVIDFPHLGFQKMITKKLLVYAFKHPFRPFPMMKA